MTLRKKIAVAVEYSDEKKESAKVAASGVGAIAEAILNIASQHDVPIHEDDALASLLRETKVGEYVSEDTVKVLGEIICFLYEMDRKKPLLSKSEASIDSIKASQESKQSVNKG